MIDHGDGVRPRASWQTYRFEGLRCLPHQEVPGGWMKDESQMAEFSNRHSLILL